MFLKKWIISITFVAWSFSSLYAKEGLEIGIGFLAPFYIAAEGIDEAELPVAFPKGSIQLGLGVVSLEVGGIAKSITVQATGDLSDCLSSSSCGIVGSELVITGQVLSILIKFDISFINEGTLIYAGYGTNQFSIDQKLSNETKNIASNSGIQFSQDLEGGEGNQILFGIDQALTESISLDFDYWLMTVPIEVSSSFLNLSSGISTQKKESIELDFTILAFGATFYF